MNQFWENSKKKKKIHLFIFVNMEGDTRGYSICIKFPLLGFWLLALGWAWLDLAFVYWEKKHSWRSVRLEIRFLMCSRL